MWQCSFISLLPYVFRRIRSRVISNKQHKLVAIFTLIGLLKNLTNLEWRLSTPCLFRRRVTETKGLARPLIGKYVYFLEQGCRLSYYKLRSFFHYFGQFYEAQLQAPYHRVKSFIGLHVKIILKWLFLNSVWGVGCIKRALYKFQRRNFSNTV